MPRSSSAPAAILVSRYLFTFPYFYFLPLHTTHILHKTNTPVCSACIRQNIDFQERSGSSPQCPSCRARCDARDLIANISLRELSQKYECAREELITLAAANRNETEKGLSVRKKKNKKPQEREGDDDRAPYDNKNIAKHPKQKNSAAVAASFRRSTRHNHRSGRGTAQIEEEEGKEDGAVAVVVSDGGHRGEKNTRGSGKRKRERKDDDDVVVIIEDNDTEEEEIEKTQTQEQEEVDSPAEYLASDHSSSSSSSSEEDEDNNSPHKRHHTHNTHQTATATATATAGAPIPQGFVECPVCSKAVPTFYINSHMDACLAGDGGGGGGQKQQKEASPNAIMRHGSGNSTGNKAPPSHPHPQTAPLVEKSSKNQEKEQKPFVPLALPPVLLPTIASDKTVRLLLKRFSLPTDRKKADMVDLYSSFRLAVATANDRQEATTYERLARQVVAKERQRAMAVMQAPTTALMAHHQQQNRIKRNGYSTGGGGGQHSNTDATDGTPPPPDAFELKNCSFEELIRVTKARDAAKKAARQIMPNTKEEEEEDGGREGGGALKENLGDGVRLSLAKQPNNEAMIAEEVKQATGIALLDDSDDDDDNW